MNLYEISNEYQLVFDQMHNEYDEEKRLALSSQLDSIKAPLENKAVNIAKYVHDLRGSQVMIDSEIERLQNMKRILLNREKDMMNYLSTNMQRCEIEKIESPFFKIQFKTCPCKVDVLDADLIPDEYKRVKTEIMIDKNKIKSEMKEGVVIPGVQLVQDKKLEIK